MNSGAPPGRRLYLGRLPTGVLREDLEKFFNPSGSVAISDIRINGNYGFIEYDQVSDAEDAMRDLNGRELLGERMVIEFARNPRSYDDRGPPRRSNPPAPRGYRLDVIGFGEGTSWQDLKDFARSAGASVSYADVSRSRADEGVIEYQSYRDVDEAFRKLDGTELNGGRIKLYEQRPPPRRRSPSPPPRRRSPSPPPRRRRSPSPYGSRRDYEDRREERVDRRRSRSPVSRD